MYVYFDARQCARARERKFFFARFTFRLHLIHKLFKDPKRGGEQRHTHTETERIGEIQGENRRLLLSPGPFPSTSHLSFSR